MMLITHINAKLNKKSRFQQDVFENLAFDPALKMFIFYTKYVDDQAYALNKMAAKFFVHLRLSTAFGSGKKIFM